MQISSITPWEVYVSLKKSNGPKTIFNAIKDDADFQWNHLPVELSLPSVLPEALQSAGVACCWEIVGPAEDPVKAAVSMGTFLKVEMLKELHTFLLFDLPEKGEGSGKSGRLVKLDYARGLVDHYFPVCAVAEKQRMVGGIMGTAQKVRERRRNLGNAARNLGSDSEILGTTQMTMSMR